MAHGDHDHGDGHGHDHKPGKTKDDFAEGLTARNPELSRGQGTGQLLYIDAFSGIAGDMLVAAMLDLGVPVAALKDALATLPLEGYRLELGHRVRHSIQAAALRVQVTERQPQRDYATIRRMLEGAKGLPDGARVLALGAFRVLAEAEASVHGTTVDAVHFHEVGAVDSIVDTVGACVAIDYLGARVVASPLPLSRGFTRSQHGRIPLPAPATALCLTDVPTVSSGLNLELVTPTGACLVKAIASDFGAWPAMRTQAIAFGAGTRHLEDRPNLLRLALGTPDSAAESQTVVQLEANLDDATGEMLGHAMERLLALGALDCWYAPIGMKKGRPGTLLCCLGRPEQQQALAQVLLTETTSLGVRTRKLDRIVRDRRLVRVATPFGDIDIKVADADGLPANIAPEYEQCRHAASAHGVPLKQVLQAAVAAYMRAVGGER